MKYRRKRPIIDAFQVPAEEESADAFLAWAEQVGLKDFTSESRGSLHIGGKGNRWCEGYIAEPGDWVLKDGDAFCVHSDVCFREIYEVVSEPATQAQIDELRDKMCSSQKPIDVAWRHERNRSMLCTSMWWCGGVGLSEQQPGKWYWDLAGIKGAHYCDTRQQAVAECQAAVLAWNDQGRTYVLAESVPDGLGILAKSFTEALGLPSDQ